MAIWALRQCYTKVDTDQGRTYHLGQIAVKAMRGIMFCWMKQAEKLEKFKADPSPKNALHSKFDIVTGQEIEDMNYGHLQINCVSLFLITLAQITTSSLQIVYTLDEVNFIQNLVFYIERAYRTPDYGMFERGTKYNNNECELHARYQ
jgi:phosphorylase kinase alpha/beta subunit